MNKLKAVVSFIKPYFVAILVMSLVATVAFLLIHKNGFVKFIQDPAFFDNVQIERSYQIKK